MKRVGCGWDLHKLVPGRTLVVGGIEIPNSKGSLGHSDGDALIHAITDSILGAAGLEDIGTQFPDTDEKYRGISSRVLLRMAHDMVRERGFEIENIDTTVILQNPKLSPYMTAIKESLSECLDLDEDCIGVKAKTAENMLGELGSGDAISAIAVALLSD